MAILGVSGKAIKGLSNYTKLALITRPPDPHACVNDLEIDLARNTPWVDMSACVKFGRDRPSRLAGHTEQTDRQTDRQTNISPFII